MAEKQQNYLISNHIKNYKGAYDVKPKDKNELIDIIKKDLKNGITDLNHIDVSNIDDMSWLFFEVAKEVKIQVQGIDISLWDVSNVEDMSYMFYGCTTFNSDLSKWNVSNVKNMSYMFYGCTNFNSDLSNWDVKSECLHYNVCLWKNFYSIQYIHSRLAITRVNSEKDIPIGTADFIDNIISNGDMPVCYTFNNKEFKEDGLSKGLNITQESDMNYCRMSLLKKFIPIFLVNGETIDKYYSPENITIDDIPKKYKNKYKDKNEKIEIPQPSQAIALYMSKGCEDVYPTRPCILLCPERIEEIKEISNINLSYADVVIHELAHAVMDPMLEYPTNEQQTVFPEESKTELEVPGYYRFYEEMWANRLMLNYLARHCTPQEYNDVLESVKNQPAGYRDAIGAVPDGWKTWLELKRGKATEDNYKDVIAKCKVI